LSEHENLKQATKCAKNILITYVPFDFAGFLTISFLFLKPVCDEPALNSIN
jgi:hypothetical protein